MQKQIPTIIMYGLFLKTGQTNNSEDNSDCRTSEILFPRYSWCMNFIQK